MRLIDGEALYERLVELENLARDRVIDTPNSFPDGSLNPAAVRYMAQLSERIQLKEMVFDAPTIKPEPHWIPVDLRNNSPEENKVVLLGVRFRDDFKYFVTSRKDYNYWTGLGREIKGELRWQPLPESYPSESEG